MLQPNMDLAMHLDSRIAPFVVPCSIALPEDVTSRLAEALANAVNIVWPALNVPTLLFVLFGRPPHYELPVGVGVEVYVPDMSLDPIGSSGSGRIYLDAFRLASFPHRDIDWAALCILEELVHSWMNIRDEASAKLVTASLMNRHYGTTFLPGDGVYRSLRGGTSLEEIAAMHPPSIES